VDLDVDIKKCTLGRTFLRIELLQENVEFSLINLHMQWNRQAVAG
jgi:hypothetical protein